MILILLNALLPLFTYCDATISKLSHKNYTEEQILVCTMLLQEAKRYPSVNTELLLAVTWEESRFFMNSSPNTSNCAGPLQIKVKYWCPSKKGIWSIHKSDGVLNKCDLISRGLFAFDYYFNKKDFSLVKKICLYGPAKKCNNYKKDRNSKRYVDAVLKDYRKIKK